VVPFPSVVSGEPLVVSATLYTTYRRCPAQALARTRGVYPAESRPSFRGNLAHRIFARHLARGPVASEDLRQACHEEIGSGLNPKLGALGLRPSDLDAVIREVGDLYQRFKMLPTDGFRSAEVSLEAEPADGVTLRGVVDAVFDQPGGGVRLVDWKTGALYEVEDQLAFYVLVWALQHDELPALIEAVSVGSGERHREVPDRAGAEETARRVADLVTRLRQAFDAGTDLERRGGPWCSFCPLLEGCAEGSAATA